MKERLALAAVACIITLSSMANGQNAPAQCSLVVVENQQGKETALVRYHLENGKLKNREVLPPPAMESALEHGGPHYGSGGDRIYLNRYVITRYGDVYDLEAGKQLRMTGGDELIACEEGKAVLFRSGDFYSYDLKAGQLAKMDDPGKWRLLLKGLPLSRPAELSPDGTKSVVDAADSQPAASVGKNVSSVFGTQGPLEVGGGRLSLCTLDAKPRVLGEGFLCKVSSKSDMQPQTPVLWLDNERILTQRGNGKLVVLKLDGSVEPVADIEIQGLPATLPAFSKDGAGRIIYTCGDSYVVDVEKKSYAKLEWQAAGDGFEIEVVKPPETPRIRYMGKEISSFDAVDPASARTMPGHVAVAPAKTNSEPRHEIRVWSSDSKSWVNLELGGNLIEIIGWVEDRDPAKAAGN